MNPAGANPAPQHPTGTQPAAAAAPQVPGPERPRVEPDPPPIERLNPADVTVDPGLLDGFRWDRLFPGRPDAPIELEIGTGKARFLLNRARRLPHHCFLGIEWANEFYRFAADRMARWGVRNVRMLRTDASVFVRNACPRHSLAAMHVYHPDPWPKARHHKRRLFQPALVSAAADCLVDGGILFVQTDHAEYFTIIAALLRAHPDLIEVPFDPPAPQRASATEDVPTADRAAEARASDGGEYADRNSLEDAVGPPSPIGTNFEEKYVREGRAIHRIAMRRKPRL
ncbi:MAG: tRNA (guanosine(46)-N7)-methyltransferase TrmB [Phycisphaerales bacterium]|nr:tRNA (guanosine(46)-N7)-methyltransferase TrmB [Phycisphaerales bacterium]